MFSGNWALRAQEVGLGGGGGGGYRGGGGEPGLCAKGGGGFVRAPRAEGPGQQKPSNDPRNNQHSPGTPTTGRRFRTNSTRHIQHSPNTPTTGLRERGNDTSRSTGRSGRQNAATRRNMRRGERVTVQGPVKKQEPDGMLHRGGGEGARTNPPPSRGRKPISPQPPTWRCSSEGHHPVIWSCHAKRGQCIWHFVRGPLRAFAWSVATSQTLLDPEDSIVWFRLAFVRDIASPDLQHHDLGTVNQIRSFDDGLPHLQPPAAAPPGGTRIAPLGHPLGCAPVVVPWWLSVLTVARLNLPVPQSYRGAKKGCGVKAVAVTGSVVVLLFKP